MWWFRLPHLCPLSLLSHERESADINIVDENMTSVNRKPRRVSTTLVREATDWGLAVSEKKPRKTWLTGIFLAVGGLAFFSSLMFALPVMVGVVLSAEMTRLGVQIALVGGLLCVAVLLAIQSKKGPRNAFELDTEASQLRLGFVNRFGAFVRQRVIPLKKIEDACIDKNGEGRPELLIQLAGEQIRIDLIDAKAKRLVDIAEQIRDAADEARKAPRSRIESSMASIGASAREISRRVVSRVVQ